jgi:hypothetical protein
MREKSVVDKIRSMFSIVPFSVTLAPTAPQLTPFSLSTSLCGSTNTAAVSLFRTSMIFRSYRGTGIDLPEPHRINVDHRCGRGSRE